MQLNEFQNECMRTAIYPVSNALEYTALGLVSEAGEVAGKVKKIIRDDGGRLTPETREALIMEYIDTAWYVAEGLRALDCTFEGAAQKLLNKLEKRSREGKIGGSGDYR